MTFLFRKPSRTVTRVFVHCSASDNPEHDNVATMDLWHKQRGWAGVGYHFFIRKSGLLEIGRNIELTPAAQEGNNLDTIAVCLHGLKAEKFTQGQFGTLNELCLQIYKAYDGEVTFHGHCEVARKACPVFDYRKVIDLDIKGHLSALKAGTALTPSRIEMPTIPGIEHLEEPGSFGVGVLQMGVKNGAVTALQKRLTALHYFVGLIDGDFGPRTRDAILAFQADNHLTPDGKFGPLTHEAIRDAKPRPVSQARAFASLSSLASDGSPVAKAAIDGRIAGAVLSAGGLLATLNETSGLISQLTDSMGAFGTLLNGIGQWQGIGLAGIGIIVAVRAYIAGRAHVAEFRSGKTA